MKNAAASASPTKAVGRMNIHAGLKSILFQ